MRDAPTRHSAALADRYRIEGEPATVYLAQDVEHDRGGRTFVVVTPVEAPAETFVVVNRADEAPRRWRAEGAR